MNDLGSEVFSSPAQNTSKSSVLVRTQNSSRDFLLANPLLLFSYTDFFSAERTTSLARINFADRRVAANFILRLRTLNRRKCWAAFTR